MEVSVKNFIFLCLTLFVFSAAHAQDYALVAPDVYLGGETKIKYDRTANKNHFKIENLLKGRFELDKSWCDAKIKLAVANPMNTEKSATINIEKLLIGHTCFQDESSKFYVQVGRCKLEDIFDSKLQYGSYMNGVNASYTYKNLEVKAAELIMNTVRNQYAFVAQVSYKNTPFIPCDITYSLNDWHQQDDFVVSQIAANYQFQGSYWPLNVYAAYSRNHKQNHSNAMYAGFNFSGVNYDCVWQIDLNFQYSEKNAIPSFDYNGMGVGAGVNIKATLAFTEHLTLQSKFGIGDNESVEISTVYKW